MDDMTHDERGDAWSKHDARTLNFDGLDLSQTIIEPPYWPVEILREADNVSSVY